ncbi:hypothetical protein HKD37_14G040104 [Glycine soja]
MSEEVVKAIIGFVPPSHMINDRKLKKLKSRYKVVSNIHDCMPLFYFSTSLTNMLSVCDQRLYGFVICFAAGLTCTLLALISIDPARARDDPIIVKNVPYYKAKKALETEVMKIDPPPRPPNWGELDLPLNASSWSEEDLKDPDKFYEMTVLLNAQREISDKILDAQWETKWRQDKLNEMLEAKVKPYIQDIDNAVLHEPILLKPQNQEKVSLSLCFAWV